MSRTRSSISGSRPDGDATELADPLIVIEVLSPATKPIDTGTKLESYFRVPSVQHYLVVDPRRPMVIHHRRGPDEIIETRVASSGQLDLSPPGLRVEVASFFDQP